MKINKNLRKICDELGIEVNAYRAADKAYYCNLIIPTFLNYNWNRVIKLSNTNPDVSLGYLAEKIMDIWSSFDIEAEVEIHKNDIGKEEGCEDLDRLIENLKYVENKLDETMEKVSGFFETNQKAMHSGHHRKRKNNEFVQTN